MRSPSNQHLSGLSINLVSVSIHKRFFRVRSSHQQADCEPLDQRTPQDTLNPTVKILEIPSRWCRDGQAGARLAANGSHYQPSLCGRGQCGFVTSLASAPFHRAWEIHIVLVQPDRAGFPCMLHHRHDITIDPAQDFGIRC